MQLLLLVLLLLLLLLLLIIINNKIIINNRNNNSAGESVFPHVFFEEGCFPCDDILLVLLVHILIV